ncbi:MAG: peptidoglycan-binding protein [Oscillospiraceae bacterium]|nr:peptidoglycan-binding protein [Oscillospiraceae bacterium]MBR2366559.1 peptidoglycan-binding protein [Oscillospiraceae bacterium]MBR2897988.1 peptidoglycan-binding protein [Oscillospiraceae bacterium]MBR2977026.1 peptidoglycan-binding protein [Oscillospiraceae bacterium]MBR3850054.1 peptidoglycan-binding protein [Oscillospiraceae bacterium]
MPPLEPYIPETITVHLGAPDEQAENVTVAFADYVKNVVSSEIYPTWQEAAIRANTLAVISFALNRVFTEYYKSRGYPFDITASTAIDQKYIEGRNIYENVSKIVDELVTSYIRRRGSLEPLAAKFCNGVTVTCDGLSQWGSQYLAQDGATVDTILRTYYGDDIEIVMGAPIQPLTPSYPGEPLKNGDVGVNVAWVQTALNRIAQDYPAIPKVTVDAIYGAGTEAAVKAFQRAFSLEEDGIVGNDTWYKLRTVYVAVTKLAELRSEGLRFTSFSWEYPERVAPGEIGAKVTQLQYMLRVLAAFNDAVSEPPLSGSYNAATEQSVRDFQLAYGLPVTGVADRETWNKIYDQFTSIRDSGFGEEDLFPILREPPAETTFALQRQLALSADALPELPKPQVNGAYDDATRESVAVFQRLTDLPVTGEADEETKKLLAEFAETQKYRYAARDGQFPGGLLSRGARDGGEQI